MAFGPATDAPLIETERLTMRGHRLEDFEALATLWGDPLVTRFILASPSSREDAWKRLLTYAGSWRMLGIGQWAVIERSTGAYIGIAGFHQMKRDIRPRFDDVPEAGWLLMPAAQGRGYAREMVAAALDWADRTLEATRTVCIINPDNQPSLRVAARCGFREVVRTAYGGKPTILLERAKPAGRNAAAPA